MTYHIGRAALVFALLHHTSPTTGAEKEAVLPYASTDVPLVGFRKTCEMFPMRGATPHAVIPKKERALNEPEDMASVIKTIATRVKEVGRHLKIDEETAYELGEFYRKNHTIGTKTIPWPHFLDFVRLKSPINFGTFIFSFECSRKPVLSQAALAKSVKRRQESLRTGFSFANC